MTRCQWELSLLPTEWWGGIFWRGDLAWKCEMGRLGKGKNRGVGPGMPASLKKKWSGLEDWYSRGRDRSGSSWRVREKLTEEAWRICQGSVSSICVTWSQRNVGSREMLSFHWKVKVRALEAWKQPWGRDSRVKNAELFAHIRAEMQQRKWRQWVGLRRKGHYDLLTMGKSGLG